MKSVRALEVLNFALVLFRRLARAERAQVLSLAGSGVRFSGIQTVLATFEFSNHNRLIASSLPSAALQGPETNQLTRFAEGQVDTPRPKQIMVPFFERQHSMVAKPRRPAPHHNISMGQWHAVRFIRPLQPAK